MTQRELQRLCDFRPGQRVTIREAQDDNPDRLRRWQELGLVPGATVEIVRFEPLDNLFEVDVDGNLVRLGPEALAGLRGELV